MHLRYRTADVFTNTVFGGNPVAVAFTRKESSRPPCKKSHGNSTIQKRRL